MIDVGKAVIIAVVAIAFVVGACAWRQSKAPTIQSNMLIISPVFQNNASIPKKYSCEGSNINPELNISNVPAEAKSLALIIHDPDAPVPGGFTHWVVWDISPTTTVIKEESVPPGSAEGMNSRAAGYTGPCPPPGHGIHHYHFMLYALDVTLNLPTSTKKADLEAAMQEHILTGTELIGLYQR